MGGLVVAVGAGAAEVPPAGGAHVGVAVEVVVFEAGVVAAGHREGRFGQVEGGAESGVDGAAEVVDAADVVAVADDGFDEGVVDPAAGDLDRDGSDATDVAGLTRTHAASPECLEVDDEDQFLGCGCGRPSWRVLVPGRSWDRVSDRMRVRCRWGGVGQAQPAGAGGSRCFGRTVVVFGAGATVFVGAVVCRGRVVGGGVGRGVPEDEVGDGVGAVAVVGLAGAGFAGGGEDPVGLGGQSGFHLGADVGLESARQGPVPVAVDAPPGPPAPS